MEVGMIGLGRMGGSMARRLLQGGHQVVVCSPQGEEVQALVGQGAHGTTSLSELVAQLSAPRAVWSMVPAGEPTEATIASLATLLSPGDVVVDGGNSHYKDSMRRAADLARRGLSLLDVGTSGGVWGLQDGYSLMVGGGEEAFRRLEPLFQTLAPAPDRGYGYVGPAGAGHFVKMVHNGIEYGLMEAYAEGFELLAAKSELRLDLARIAEVWRSGSVVRSWLLDLTAAALREDPKLEGLRGYVEDTGEGLWTVQESLELAVPVPVIALSLQARFRSRQSQPFGARLLVALRHRFGGHPLPKAE